MNKPVEGNGLVGARTQVDESGDSVPAGIRTSDCAKPLRVLHIINGLSLGGAETLLWRVTTSHSLHEHTIVSLARPAWYSSQLQAHGIKVHHLDMETLAAVPQGIAKLRRIIRESRADVVQCWMYRSNVLGGILAKAARKPVIWGVHCASIDDLRPSSRALARISGVLARWTPDVVVNCSSRSADLHGTIGYSAAAGTVIHNGYDPSEFAPDEQARRATRDALGVDRHEFVIGSITRWDSLKDIPNLLKAIRIVVDGGVPFRAFLIGTGLSNENAALQREIRRCGCTGHVTLLGRRADIEDLARAFDLHVLASRTEAFPNVVAETMLCGTPNAVTDVGDAGAMVGETGWAVPPSAPERLANAIVEAVGEWKDDRARWEERRRSAREHISQNFSFETMLGAYEKLWSTVAGSK